MMRKSGTIENGGFVVLDEQSIPYAKSLDSTASGITGQRQELATSSRSSEGRQRGFASPWPPWPIHTSQRPRMSVEAKPRYPPSSSAGSARSASTSPPSPYRRTLDSPPPTPPDCSSAGYILSNQPRCASDLAKEQSGKEKLLGLGNASASSTALQVATTISPSRNDIFSHPSPQLAPAPRLSQKSAGGGQADSPASMKSRNSLFFDSPSVETMLTPLSPRRSPLSARPSVLPASTAQSPRSDSLEEIAGAGGRGHHSLQPDASDRPTYGRSSTEERERERDRIRASKDIDFRLCPNKDFLLGEGRHCNVFLGSYRTRQSTRRPSMYQQQETHAVVDGCDNSDDGTSEWRLCAVKRLHADRQSQLLGLDEAFALRRLGFHPNIVRLIDVRDEVELVASSPQPEAAGGVRAGTGVFPDRQSSSDLPAGTFQHGRSISSALPRTTADQHATDRRDSHAEPPARTHRRLGSQPVENEREAPTAPAARVAGPDEFGTGRSVSRSPSASRGLDTRRAPLPDRASQDNSTDPPRLLILLELLPVSLATYSRKHPESVDLRQWANWALQIARTVEWRHARGCVHVDIKPENILLSDALEVKLCDFNSAVFPNAGTPLLDGAGLGTPAYGAPELTRGASSSSRNGFSYPVDIWSMGAVLYALATGVAPLAKSRSMIDLLYRKRAFFESEENDRVARIHVAGGYNGSVVGSNAASRNGSLRGRKSRGARQSGSESATHAAGFVPQAHSLRREASMESIDSVSSNIVLEDGRRTVSLRAISMLLSDSPLTGVLPTDHAVLKGAAELEPGRNGNISAATQHHRTASLGKAHLASKHPHAIATQVRSGISTSGEAKINPSERHPERPVVNLRRATSYGAEKSGSEGTEFVEHPEPGSPQSPLVSKKAPTGTNGLLSPPQSPQISMDRLSSTNAGSLHAGLRSAISAAFAQDARRRGQDNNLTSAEVSASVDGRARSLSGASALVLPRSPLSTSHNISDFGVAGAEDSLQVEDDETEDERPYEDGTPALILPGGGRLPNGARNLLEQMLSFDPARRPNASQVVSMLERLAL